MIRLALIGTPEWLMILAVIVLIFGGARSRSSPRDGQEHHGVQKV
jgi:Sec-independent protein translocase protein TatA